MLMANVAQRSPSYPKIQMSFIDVAKAHVHARPSRNVYVRVPRELGLAPGTYGRLKKCCYGTRDAGAPWEECYASALVDHGFRRGVVCPTCFVHESKQISIVVHGDDFVALGEEELLDWYESAMATKFETGDRCRLGKGKQDSKEARVLNRIVRLTDAGLRFEADPRPYELLTRSLGLTNTMKTPGVKPNYLEVMGQEDEEDAVDDEVIPVASVASRPPAKGKCVSILMLRSDTCVLLPDSLVVRLVHVLFKALLEIPSLFPLIPAPILTLARAPMRCGGNTLNLFVLISTVVSSSFVTSSRTARPGRPPMLSVCKCGWL